MTNPFSEFQPTAAIATTPTAAQTLQRLTSIGVTLWLPDALEQSQTAQTYSGSLKAHIASLWPDHRAFVFGLAAGAVVRLIAPLLKDKASDPAVIVVDAEGKFVISLCGGHQGGGDRLVQLIARQLGATPILTGGAATLDLPGVDVLGVPYGWQRGEGNWTGVSAAIARQEPLRIVQEAGSPLWQQQIDLKNTPESNAPTLWISPQQRSLAPDSTPPQVQWHPRVLWLGVGCERGTSQALIARAITETLQRHQLAAGAIAGIATIDLKADEAGIVDLCRQRNFPLRTFPPETLRQVAVPTPSSVVEAEVGTPSVAEAAALCASNAASLLVPKQIFKTEREGGATLAIAQAEREYIGRTGQLFLVGMGPGSLAQMTPAAQTAITQADAVIGYSLYIDLIAPLFRPGQIIEALPITQEQKRSQRAIELARWGLSVAVVSSGDCGIYGMAGLVLEELREQGWDGKTPQVQVLPGISALQAAASLVGAPLMHDFCGISLSDLLTPWATIEKRLHAAAAADFVTALYNPRSQKRTQQIEIAQKIFLEHRDRKTPVAIVRSAYRPDEQITLTTLEKMLEAPIDMLTTVIIGNCTTQHYADLLITPRGYLVS